METKFEHSIDRIKLLLSEGVTQFGVLNGAPCRCTDIECCQCDLSNFSHSKYGDGFCYKRFWEWASEKYVDPESPKAPYEKDELIEVSNDHFNWHIRHFDKMSGGGVFVYENGRKSCNALGSSYWKYHQKYGTLGGLTDGEEIPKKVKYDEYGREEGYPHCPNCGKTLINDLVDATYCIDCGQKLDWNEGGKE